MVQFRLLNCVTKDFTVPVGGCFWYYSHMILTLLAYDFNTF